MRKRVTWPVLLGLTVAVVLTIASSAFGQKQKIKGLIVGRDGPNVIVKNQNTGGYVTVTLNDSTKVKVVKGKFGLRKSDMSFAALIPGLQVEVEAEPNVDGQLIATKVKFRASALKTANRIQAGLTPTQQELAQARKDLSETQESVETNRQDIESSQQDIQAHEEAIAKAQADQASLQKRFGELTDYDVKATTTVYFAVNSATINEQGKADLKAFADQAKQIKSYLIQVAGYTDSSGSADYNQQLSDRRAAAVTAYLRQSCGVPLFRVLAPAAMGMSGPAASNETPAGKAANRRVVVKIIVNRGMAVHPD